MSGKKSASDKPIRVLYDGWPLAWSTTGEVQAALHLLELLEALPETVEPWLALPGELAPGIDLPACVRRVAATEMQTPLGRLHWEQIRLPGLARRVGARLLHTTSPYLPLFSPVPGIASPADRLPPASASRRMAERWRESLGMAGLNSAACVLWPSDLPAPDGRAALQRLPPYVHPAFTEPQTGEPVSPAPFILAPGPLDFEQIHLLAAVWSWVSAGLDDEWELLVSDLPPGGLSQLHQACRSMGIESARYAAQVGALSLETLQARAAAFQQAQVVLCVGQVRPWGDPLLHALACGRPLVSVDTPWVDARVGPAAYLAEADDPRGLGAAVLTLVTEESMAERLSQAARQRAKGYQAAAFREAIQAVYEEVAALS